MHRADQVLFGNYARFALALTNGQGCRVVDASGHAYLDFTGGIAVSALGHCHPKMVAAIQEQSQRLLHTSNLYYTEPQVELAEAIVSSSFGDRVFFCNSGAEANEGAIKLARKAMGPDRYEIITTLASFHGRTLTTMAATGQDKIKDGFHPLPSGFVHVPFDDLDAVAAAIKPHTAAVLVEPVQGESGVNMPSDDYLPGLRALCDEHGILLMLDEVQTGVGRCGSLYAYQLAGIEPDVMTLAKGLGGGLPIGALVAREALAGTLGPGTHGTTFGGGPMVCAGANVVMQSLLENSYLLDNVQEMGDRLQDGLRTLAERFSTIVQVRGQGLLIGCQLDQPSRPVVQSCIDAGLLVTAAGGNVVRFSPPLNITEADVDEALTRFSQAMDRHTRALEAQS